VRVAGPRGDLSAVSAVSPGVAWAVGSRGEGVSRSRPLALRWNGRTWTSVPSARLHGGLSGVSVVSATDAWAVGGIETAAGTEGVIERWNGVRWRTALIDSRAGSFFTAVTARGSGFGWAAGWSSGVGVLTLAWHGSAWRRVPARCASEACFLLSVAVVSRRLAWAVGGRLDLRNYSLLPVIMRWNGSAWKAGPSPSAAGPLGGVVALSSRNAFAVGGNAILGSIGKSLPTIEHWNGTTWRLDHQAG
jgi:hypothetical protein